MMMKKLKAAALVGVALAGLTAGSTAQAATTVFTDRALWQAAVDAANGITTTDTFSTDIAPADTITLSSGIVSANSLPGRLFLDNGVGSGSYRNNVDGRALSASETITWTFPIPIFAFGADFFSVTAGTAQITASFSGSSETFNLGGELGASPGTTVSGFIGFLGTSTITSLVFSSAILENDFFRIDNASFATPIPIPAALPLFATGVAAVAYAGRRKRKAAQATA
jgi:hypothetical protein